MVPNVPWMFESNPAEVDRIRFTQIEKQSKIWVLKTKLLVLQREGTDIESYATRLMWNHIADTENRVTALSVKFNGAGFVKLFDKDNLNSV